MDPRRATRGPTPWGRLRGAACARLRPANAALFFLGRSGSTVLGDLLRRHPAIRWGDEIYALRAQQGREGVDPYDFLRVQMLPAGLRVFGGEIKFWHLTRMGVALPDFVARIRRMGFGHFVLLERRNLLRRLVSARLLRQTHRPSQRVGEARRLVRLHLAVEGFPRPGDGQVLPLLERLRADRRDYEDARRLLARERLLELSFEDDVLPDPRIGYGRICAFLGVEPLEEEVRLQRVNPYKLSEMLENFAEVEAALRDTEFAWMLDD